jgi:phage baseplate assembly protein W
MADISYPATENAFYRTVNAIWPDLLGGKVTISPARNGMNRETGKLMQGWGHVEQSMRVIFATPFHERVLRRWVGSFVPRLLGETYVSRIILRFFWAIASAVDLWEPDYRIRQVYYMGPAINPTGDPMLELATTSAAMMIRTGEAIFRTEGVWRPRAHLGDFSPFQVQQSELVGRGDGLWDVMPVNFGSS